MPSLSAWRRAAVATVLSGIAVGVTLLVARPGRVHASAPTPSLRVRPSSGGPASTVTAMGAGFPSDAHGVIRVGRVRVRRVRTDPRGRFAVTLVIPANSRGQVVVSARIARRRGRRPAPAVARAVFRVRAAAPGRPAGGPRPGTAGTGPTASTPPPGTPRAASPVSHVVWIVMENKGYAQVIGSPGAPYENGLASSYGLATDMSAVSHPSLPNYVALTSGSTQGVADDAGPSSHPLGATSVFAQMHGDWRSLEESMPAPCVRASGGDYAVRHNPAVYYTSIAAECGARDVPLAPTPDISARFTFITPDLCSDTHDCSVGTGDAWLAAFVPKLLATPEYAGGSTVIFLTWDENDGSAGNRVPAIVISPWTHGVRDDTPFTHYSVLRTTEELLGVPLLGDAQTASSMRAAFHIP
jgi:phosphatidylinositol-3-phosphatase